ncbi:MAG: hypothetical protein COV07_00720, partial [Candidatus Vogelbacteria bacterium CG10_big_fil_rev_8_21_14_0_10_45_14]
MDIAFMIKLLEAVLFVEGGEILRTDLQKKLSIKEDELAILATSLRDVLQDRGIALLETESSLCLTTSSLVAKEMQRIH